MNSPDCLPKINAVAKAIEKSPQSDDSTTFEHPLQELSVAVWYGIKQT